MGVRRGVVVWEGTGRGLFLHEISPFWAQTLKDQEYCSLEPLKESGHCSYTYVEKEMATHSSILT